LDESRNHQRLGKAQGGDKETPCYPLAPSLCLLRLLRPSAIMGPAANHFLGLEPTRYWDWSRLAELCSDLSVANTLRGYLPASFPVGHHLGAAPTSPAKPCLHCRGID
jgi:hypothetical protein